MDPSEFVFDPTWTDLSNQVALADAYVQKLLALGASDRELLQAEALLEEAREELLAREELISHPDWGVY